MTRVSHLRIRVQEFRNKKSLEFGISEPEFKDTLELSPDMV